MQCVKRTLMYSLIEIKLNFVCEEKLCWTRSFLPKFVTFTEDQSILVEVPIKLDLEQEMRFMLILKVNGTLPVKHK